MRNAFIAFGLIASAAVAATSASAQFSGISSMTPLVTDISGPSLMGAAAAASGGTGSTTTTSTTTTTGG